MGILLSCSHVSTTVWLHHLDSNKMPEVKACWELHKTVVCCFEQILEAVVLPLTSHLTNHPIKMGKTCHILLEK